MTYHVAHLVIDVWSAPRLKVQYQRFLYTWFTYHDQFQQLYHLLAILKGIREKWRYVFSGSSTFFLIPLQE